MDASVRNRIIATTIAGAALTGLAAGTLAWFVTAEWFTDHGPYDKSTWGGFTLAQLIALIIFTFAAPMAFTLLFIAWQQTIRHAADVSSTRHGIVVAIGVVGLIILAVLGGLWATEFLACMGFACYGATLLAAVALTDNTDSVYGWKVTVGVSVMFTSIFLGIAIIGAYIRAVWSAANKHKSTSEQSSEEGATLLRGENSSEKTNAIVATYVNTGNALLWAGYFVYAGLLLLWWLLPTAIIPASWEFFQPSRIAYNAYNELTTDGDCGSSPPRFCAELEGAPLTSINIAVNDYLNLKIFPSSIIFFSWLLIVPLLSLIVLEFKFLRRVFSKKVSFFGSLFSFGELAFFSLFLLLISLWMYYWIGSHNFHGKDAVVEEKEIMFRSLGQLAVLIMTLLLIPAARSSLVASFFRVSWEASMQYHRWLGILWVVAVLAHVFAYWIYLASQGTLADYWYPLHYSGSLDNFTIPHAETIMIFALITLIIGAIWERTRRRHFEWFYYSHHVTYCVLIATVLWHAAAAWMYLLPAVTVWFADRVLRAYRSSRAVRITEMHARNCGAAGHVTEIHCSVAVGSSYQPGQYCFVNIAELSILEWHPFTIAGATKDKLVFMVKSMGADTWTGKLYQLAEKMEKQNASSASGNVTCTLSVDGPVGLPHDYSKYQSVILVGCGIGITPIASLWASLRAHSVQGRSVHLLWVARDRALFQLMSDTLSSASTPSGDANGAASSSSIGDSAQLFHCPPSTTDGTDERKNGDTVDEKAPADLPASVAALITKGRPNWDTRLPALASADPSRTLVFMCGPIQASDHVEKLANQKGWDFHTETFEL